MSSLSRAHAAADHDAWLRYFASPELAAVTITVTEAGYLRRRRRRPRRRQPEVQADLEALRSDPAGASAHRSRAPGRRARRPAAGRTPARSRSCRATTCPATARWSRGSSATSPSSSTRPGRVAGGLGGRRDDDGRPDHAAHDAGGRRAPCSRPPGSTTAARSSPSRFTSGCSAARSRPGGPRWEDAGATFTDDVTPYEHRKLWLLNGAHSLLAYAGSIRGHTTVAEAVADETCRSWLEEWWAEASPHLDQPADEVAAYRAALLDRFANPRMRHRLAQIAADGSQKLPIRILPVLRAERAAGRMPDGATRVLAAWICHLRGLGAPVSDARADEVVPLAQGPLSEAVPRVLGRAGPGARRRRRRRDDRRRSEQGVLPAGEVT